MYAGITSVTFRNLSWRSIIHHATDWELTGIEWGMDVHMLPGEKHIDTALEITRETRGNGLELFSMGSYYKCGESLQDDFDDILFTAARVAVPLIRVWGGSRGPNQHSKQQYHTVVKDLKRICTMAREYGIKIGLEYHRNTLTETAESTLRLLDEVSTDNLYTYWQPNPDINFQENKRALGLMLPYLCALHVFHWKKGDIRYELSEGGNDWSEYLALAAHTNIPCILEFVKESSVEIARKDAETLKLLLKQFDS